MKKMLPILSAAVAVLLAGGSPPVLAGDVVERETTEKTTTYSGTVSQVDPSSSTIMLRSESATAPQRYTYTKKTTFTDENGNTVTQTEIQNRPVTVYYTKEGDALIATRVVVTRPTGGVIQRKEKTTTERMEEDAD